MSNIHYKRGPHARLPATMPSPNWRGYPCKVVRVFGGGNYRGAPRRMARMTGIPVDTIYHWLYTGTIPSARHAHLFQVARRHGLPLKPEHFFDLDDDGSAPEDEEQAA